MSEIRYVPPAAASGVTGSGAAGQVTFWSATTVLAGSNNLFWDNTNARLGIGTTTPGVKLDIHGTGIIQQLNGLTTNNSYLDFQNAGSTKFRIGNTYNAGQNRLSIFNAAGTTEILTALQTGYIGIGTNTPAYPLDVNGTTGTFNNLGSFNSSDPLLGIGIYSTASSNPTPSIRFLTNFGSYRTWLYGAAGNLGFTNYYAGTTPQISFYGSGNLGIGTALTDIGAKLGIQGSGSTSSTLSILVRNSSIVKTFQIDDSGTGYILNGFNFNTGNNYITATSTLMTIAAVNSATSDLQIIPFRQVNINNTGTYTAQASAILQLDSTSKGFLPPRMTNAQRTAIASPSIGLIVYCTDAVEGLYIYKSTGWTFII